RPRSRTGHRGAGNIPRAPEDGRRRDEVDKVTGATMPSRETLRRLCRARDLLRDCLDQELTLQDVCVEAEFSPWHLLRAFRTTFGETPHEFLTRMRLERARDLLTVTSRPVTEICFDVGFTSLGSFSTLFRRYIGV